MNNLIILAASLDHLKEAVESNHYILIFINIQWILSKIICLFTLNMIYLIKKFEDSPKKKSN